MVLAFHARQSTKDIDAIFAPTTRIREIALEMARERDWDQGWFNDGVKGFISTNHQTTSVGLPQFANLNVTIPIPEYLFAMKCMAARVGLAENQDFADALLLKNHLKLSTVKEAFELLELYYPKKQIPPRSQYFIESIFENSESK